MASRKSKFPIPIDNKKFSPDPKKSKRCPVCKKGNVFHPKSHASISGGALLLGPREKMGVRTVKKTRALKGYLWFDFFRDRKEVAASDEMFESYISVPLAVDVVGGQFELFFCSINCMRVFVNSRLDELETKVKEVKSK